MTTQKNSAELSSANEARSKTANQKLAAATQQPTAKSDDAQLDHLVSIARQLRNLSSDLEYWNVGDTQAHTEHDAMHRSIVGSVDDSIFQLASSYEQQLADLSGAERTPWTVPLRHLQKGAPAASISLPPPAEDSDFSLERSLRTSMFNYDFGEENAMLGSTGPGTESAALVDQSEKLFEAHDSSYEKLLSVLTFPIDLQKTSKGLVRLHEKYIQPLLSESMSSENVSMIKILETERNKLIEKIDRLLTLSKGNLTEDLNQVYEENNRNVSQTIAKLIDPTRKDTKSVMLSMAVHLQIYAECLIDIAHTIVSAEISNRIRMRFFKCMANEDIEQEGRVQCLDELPEGEEEQKSVFRDIPSFTKNGHSTFESLVTDDEIESFAAGLFEAYGQQPDSMLMNEQMFSALEHFVERVAKKLEDDFLSMHKPGEASPRAVTSASDRKARAALIETDAPLAPLLNRQTCQSCKHSIDKSKKHIGNERLADLQLFMQSHPGQFTPAERAVTNYYAWLLHRRESRNADDGKQRGMWLTYRNVHDFLHGGQIGDYPLPEPSTKPVSKKAAGDKKAAVAPQGTAEQGSTSLPLFVPPTVVNAEARTEKEPRCMSSLIENIQIARSADIQESFSQSIVKLLNNKVLDTWGIGIDPPVAPSPSAQAKKCCPSIRPDDSDGAAAHAPDDAFMEFFNDRVRANAAKARGAFPETPCIVWPVLFQSVPQDRLRKVFESIAKLKPSGALNDASAFPSHLAWVYPAPESPMVKHVLQTLFRIGLEKVIQVLEKNRLMSDSILLPKNISEETPFKRVPFEADEQSKQESAPEVAQESASAFFDILTHFSSNPCDTGDSHSAALRDNFYVPPTKQHLIEQLEWNFVNILRKSADIYKCLIFGAGAIKGHRLLSRSDGARASEGADSRMDDTPMPEDGDKQKPFPFSYANLRELYEQIYVIGLQHCLLNLRPRLLKQIYNDVRKTCEHPKASDSQAREELSSEKQLQYVVRRIVPREETRQRMKKEAKSCQCAPGDRDLQYQCEGSWILVPSPRAPVSDPRGPLFEMDGNQRGFARGGADTLTGKIRFRLRGLHILRSRTFASVLPMQGKGRSERDSGNVQFPYRFYSPTFFFAGKYWSILAMVNRIKHKNFLSLYLCCVDTVYCHFGFVLLNMKAVDRTEMSGDITEGDILHEGHQLFDRSNKENDYGFSNIVEVHRLFAPEAGFYDAATDSCVFDTIITVYGEKRTDEKLIKTNGIQKVKESSTHASAITKEKVENIMDIIDGKPALKARKDEVGGPVDDALRGKLSKDGVSPDDLLSNQQYKMLREKYRSFYRNYKCGYRSSGDEACPSDSEGSASDSQYYGDTIAASYRARAVSEATQAIRSKESEETRQKLLDDEEKEKNREQRKETLKRIKKEKSKLLEDEKAMRDDLDEQYDMAVEELTAQFDKKLQTLKKKAKEKQLKEEQRAKVQKQAALAAEKVEKKKAEQLAAQKALAKDVKPADAKATQKLNENEWLSSSKKSSKAAAQQKAEPAPKATGAAVRSKSVAPRVEKPAPEAKPQPKVVHAQQGAQKKAQVAQQPTWVKPKVAEAAPRKAEATLSVQPAPKAGTAPTWPAKPKTAPVLNSLPAGKPLADTKPVGSAVKPPAAASDPKSKQSAPPTKAKAQSAEKAPSKQEAPGAKHDTKAERIGVTYAWRDDDDDLPVPSHAAEHFHSPARPELRTTVAPPPLFAENWTVSPRGESPRQSWNSIFGGQGFGSEPMPRITLPKLGDHSDGEGSTLDWDFSSRLWSGSANSKSEDSPKENAFSFFSGLRM